MYAVCKLPHWVVDVDRYNGFDRAKGLSNKPEFYPLLKEIRSLIPVDGDDWVHHIEVEVKPGQKNHMAQRHHKHSEWTAVFYVKVGDPPVPIIVEGEEITPAPGDVIIMPPHTDHCVAPSHSKTDRLSFAMLVKDPEGESKYG